jgi:hypothetical protein
MRIQKNDTNLNFKMNLTGVNMMILPDEFKKMQASIADIKPLQTLVRLEKMPEPPHNDLPHRYRLGIDKNGQIVEPSVISFPNYDLTKMATRLSKLLKRSTK